MLAFVFITACIHTYAYMHPPHPPTHPHIHLCMKICAWQISFSSRVQFCIFFFHFCPWIQLSYIYSNIGCVCRCKKWVCMWYSRRQGKRTESAFWIVLRLHCSIAMWPHAYIHVHIYVYYVPCSPCEGSKAAIYYHYFTHHTSMPVCHLCTSYVCQCNQFLACWCR